MKQSHKTILLWGSLILLALGVWRFGATMQSDEKEIPFSEFVDGIETDNPDARVTEIVIKGEVITGKRKEGDRTVEFKTRGVVGEKLQELMHQRDLKVKYEEKEQGGFWQSVLITWLPMIFLFAIFFIFMRQIQAGGGKAMSFGKSKARLLSDNQKRVTFADVAGIDEAKEELQEVVEFLKDPKKFTRLGGRIPKGVLLMGPPGTGKTLLARGVAGEAGVPFYSISGSDFVEMFVGVGASRVRDLFEQGKKNAPCIIFIDEIDAVGRHRGAGLGGGHDEREQTLNQLLVEMDGFESNDGVILVAATNRPDVLDPALLRPGRFDRRVVVPLPDLKGRTGILEVHTRKTPLGDDVSLETIGRGTPGFSGADLENLVNEAALLAARKGKSQVEHADFEDAKDKVLMGSEMRSRVVSDKEKRATAYHEAGHALVSALIPGSDPIHKVTIIPRGKALGLTQQLPTEDRLSMSKTDALNVIAFMLGGRIAEEVVLDQRTTGAGNDLERATNLARKMVCQWGMSDELGPLTYGKVEEHIFLGREINRRQDYSGETAVRIDKEVRAIIDGQYDRARKLIEGHREVLDAMAEGLLQLETLDGEEVRLLVEGKGLEALHDRRRKGEERRAAASPRQSFESLLSQVGSEEAESPKPQRPPAEPALGEGATPREAKPAAPPTLSEDSGWRAPRGDSEPRSSEDVSSTPQREGKDEARSS